MHRWIESLKIIRAISEDIFRAASKEKVMYGFLILALIFMSSVNVPFLAKNQAAFQDMTPAQSARMLGFSWITLFMLLTSIFMSLNVLQDVLSEENLSLLLSKPIQRWHVIEGIFLGLFKVLFLNWLVMMLALWFFVYIHAGTLSSDIWIGSGVNLLLVCIYISLVIFFYSFIPNATSGVLTFFIVIAGIGGSLPETESFITSLPRSVSWLAGLGLGMLPKINPLFGISLDLLNVFHHTIAYLPVFVHSMIFLCVVHLLSCMKFSRLPQ